MNQYLVKELRKRLWKKDGLQYACDMLQFGKELRSVNCHPCFHRSLEDVKIIWIFVRLSIIKALIGVIFVLGFNSIYLFFNNFHLLIRRNINVWRTIIVLGVFDVSLTYHDLMYLYVMALLSGSCSLSVPPWGRRGFKSRIRPPYPQRVVKGD